MSVVGFDIGNENCVIATAKHRGIDVLLNDESKHETPAVVSFGEKQRFLGSAGAASAAMNLKSTISQVKRLIGRSYNEPSVKHDLQLLPFETSESQGGGILIHIKYMNERRTFTPMQILGMLFVHLKQMTQKNLESPIVDCVIGIPSYFTDLQRREYLDAASIAGLTPLRLMHDCTAIALGYGIYKTDISNSGPTIVIFVDIGHCDTQVAVAAFEPNRMKILSHAFDQNLGGRDFDEVLYKYFAEEFNACYHIDVYSNTRASIRLRASCEKLKKVLSANAEAHLSIECLMEDIDVEGFITREAFESLSSYLLERIIMPCRIAVAESGIDMKNIDCIELVGSGSRIPAITTLLTEFFQKEPRRTLNASECVARGCALQCAMLSRTIQVRDYEVQDSFPYTIGLCSVRGKNDTPLNNKLFKRGSPFPSLNVLTFSQSTTFCLDVCYTNETDLPAKMPPFDSFEIGPFENSGAEKAKVEVKFHLNIHGIFIIESALLLEYEHTSSYNDHLHSKGKLAKAKGYILNSVVPRKLADSSTSTYHGDETREGRVWKLNLGVSGNLYGNTTRHKLLQEAQETERMLAEQDVIVERTKEKRNTLESFVYDIRSKLESSYQKFADKSEKEGIFRCLLETEEWLYEDGDDESEQVYNTKLKDLRKLLDPIEKRFKDANAKAQAKKALLNRIAEYNMLADTLPPVQKEKVSEECMNARLWLNDVSKWRASDINQKMENLEMRCERIMGSKSTTPRCYEAVDSEERRNSERRSHVHNGRMKTKETLNDWSKRDSSRSSDINRGMEDLGRRGRFEDPMRSKSSSSRNDEPGKGES